jgi:hypothetical protein
MDLWNDPNVDPRLIAILNAARGTGLPEGYDARFISGYRPGDPRNHGKGLAGDIEIIDPQGNVVPNYQKASSFNTYKAFADAAREQQQKLYPELNDQFRWGGYFSGPKGKYGAMDLMHFDISKTPMAGGSWASGLTPQQAAMWGIKNQPQQVAQNNPAAAPMPAPSAASLPAPVVSPAIPTAPPATPLQPQGLLQRVQSGTPSPLAVSMGLSAPTANTMGNLGGLLSSMLGAQQQAPQAPQGYEHRPDDPRKYQDIFGGLFA